jgi:hypothetical protein
MGYFGSLGYFWYSEEYRYYQDCADPSLCGSTLWPALYQDSIMFFLLAVGFVLFAWLSLTGRYILNQKLPAIAVMIISVAMTLFSAAYYMFVSAFPLIGPPIYMPL